MAYSILCASDCLFKLTALQRLSLLTACLGHDLDHPGYNNVYQINAKTDLAIVYNDCSPLENHHAAVLFAILNQEASNLFAKMSSEDVGAARKIMIRTILATDMAKHGEMMAGFNSINAVFDWENNEHVNLVILANC